MKILVIDDQERNLQSARELLPEYGELTTAQTIPTAWNILCSEQFDVVLTDMLMPPVAEDHIRRVFTKSLPGYEVPAGLVFAISAANMGSRVVICTDSDHHKDYLCALLDLVPRTRSNKDNSVRTTCVEARNAFVGRSGYPDEGPLVKDWLQVMLESGLFPELVDRLEAHCEKDQKLKDKKVR